MKIALMCEGQWSCRAGPDAIQMIGLMLTKQMALFSDVVAPDSDESAPDQSLLVSPSQASHSSRAHPKVGRDSHPTS